MHHAPNLARMRVPVWAALFGVLAAVLTACQRPLPTVTVSGDGKSVLVEAANYRFAGGPLHEPIRDVAQAPSLSVRAGSTLLVDVPRAVANNAWVVAAFTLDPAGKTHPLAGAGSVSAIRDRHITHLDTTPAGVGSYYIQVAEIRGAQQVGGWILHVTTTA